MKYLLLTLSILLATNVQAEKSVEAIDKDCATYSKVAEDIAAVRYKGLSMRDAIRLTREYIEEKNMRENEHEILRGLVHAAYTLPAHTNKQTQAAAVREYGNIVYRKCLEKLGGLEDTDNL